MSPVASNLHFLDLLPREDSALAEILRGLARRPKDLSPKYFYDDAGCALFERICDLPEYYLTRAELGLMEAHLGEIAAFLGPGRQLIEFGSGSGRKTRILLQAARPASYVAIDIARAALETACAALAAEFPALPVWAVRADFTHPLTLPSLEGLAGARRAVYFPGSTVGNFTREQAKDFLAGVRRLVGGGGALVIGVDLKKSPQRLHDAYNDAAGVTAAFNLNMLAHLNRRYGADFDLSGFAHLAFYDESLGRIEMHLRALRRQHVAVAGRSFGFEAGELMRTEISCKYGVEEFREMAEAAGFAAARVWFDAERLFAVHGLVAR